MNADRKKPSQLLHEAVAAIKEGEVSTKARDCGQKRSYFGKIRREPVNVGIDSFRDICEGLGVSADDLLGLVKPDLSKVSAVALRDAERKAEKAEREVVRMQEALNKLLRPTPSKPPR